MEDTQGQTKTAGTGIWLLVLVCMGVVIACLAGGAAYTGISAARLTAAKASAGQIESVYLLADTLARQQGLRPQADSGERLLKSYEDGENTALTEYENFVLTTMLEVLGPERDFDFAISHFEDGSGPHTQVYYFPFKGQTNLSRDRYYFAVDGTIRESNSF